MKKLLINENNILVYISDICETVVNGFFVGNNMVFNPDGLHIEEVGSVPEEVIPQKYCYTQDDGFYLNENYIDPATIDIEKE